jgi:hypothetical protein
MLSGVTAQFKPVSLAACEPAGSKIFGKIAFSKNFVLSYHTLKVRH